MKEIIVKNYREIPAQVQTQGDNRFSVKPVIEVFYIISGKATVKTEKGDIHLNAGDIICFPADVSGSHVISNPSETEKLIYLDVGTANRPDVVHFTGTNAGMVVAREGIYNFSK